MCVLLKVAGSWVGEGEAATGDIVVVGVRGTIRYASADTYEPPAGKVG